MRAIFTQVEIPYFNALTAGQYDASNSFDANTPLSHAGYSLAVLDSYQRSGPTIQPATLEAFQEDGDYPVLPPGGEEAMGMGSKEERAASASKCAVYDIPCYFNEIVTGDIIKDLAKRFGLLILAVLILLVAIIRLR